MCLEQKNWIIYLDKKTFEIEIENKYLILFSFRPIKYWQWIHVCYDEICPWWKHVSSEYKKPLAINRSNLEFSTCSIYMYIYISFFFVSNTNHQVSNVLEFLFLTAQQRINQWFIYLFHSTWVVAQNPHYPLGARSPLLWWMVRLFKVLSENVQRCNLACLFYFLE